MVEKQMTMLMLSRRGLSTSVLDAGYTNGIKYERTSNALLAFIRAGKVNVTVIKNLVALMRDTNELVILVHYSPITPEAKRALAQLPCIQTFTYDEMSFDLILVVPKHVLVTEPRHKEWKRFPCIYSSDPVCRYYAFKPGDIVCVEEDDDTLTYRRCI